VGGVAQSPSLTSLTPLPTKKTKSLYRKPASRHFVMYDYRPLKAPHSDGTYRRAMSLPAHTLDASLDQTFGKENPR
jgi:hypothetical protein